jgi:drug/metabolite transporter (DMT)-like permease
LLGGLLALLAAATFALNAATARRAVLRASVLQGLAITVPLGVPLFLLVAWAFGEAARLATLPGEAVLWFAAAGVVHFVFGRYCNYRAAKAIGANLSAPIMQTDILLSLTLAIVVLGETLTPLRMIGIVLVLIGPALVFQGGGIRRAVGAAPAPAAHLGAAAGFKPKYAEGYLFSLLCAAGFGTSPILISIGLEKAGPGSSLAGGFISYAAGALVIAAVLLASGQVRHVLAIEREPAKWFMLTGLLVCLSQIFRYAALSLAPVSVVAPIQRLSNIFRIYASWIINPEHEVFDKSVILATVVSLVGAALLSVSTEAVIAAVPLPEWLVAAARWRWP